MNCKGKETRISIVEKYYVYPQAHLKLLNGQFKHSDAEAKITDHYYIFILIDKKDKTKKDTICCGYKAAKHFEELTGKKLPRLYSPIKDTSPHKDKTDNIYDKDHTKIVWDETIKQLYDAVMLIILLWNASPGTDIFTIKYYLENYTYLKPPLQKIKGVNTIIKSRKVPLTDHIKKMSDKNNFKEYKFDLLVKILEENNIKQYFQE